MNNYGTGQENKIRGAGRDHQTTDTCKTAQAVEPTDNEDKTKVVSRFPTKPDIIVTTRQQTVLFEPQNQRASEWLHRRCQLTVENATGHTELRVHPSRRKGIVEELKAAGFRVEY